MSAAALLGRLRDERGIGMPLTIGVLAIVLSLTAWTVTSSSDLHRTSETSRDTKRALGPADAGIERAVWRLARTPAPAIADCVVSSASGDTVAPKSGGNCPAAVATPMGNSASYSYTVEPEATSATGSCAGAPIAIGDRCVTATGTANGVTRRVQSLLRRQVVATTYDFTGMVGKTWITLGNSVEAFICGGETPGRIGSNGSIQFGNSIKLGESCGGSGAWGVAHPGTPGLVTGSATPNPTNTNPPTTHTMPAVDPGDTAAVNNNGALTGAGWVWDGGGSAQRQLRVTQNKVLPAGTYNFCSLTLDNGNLDVAWGGTATIYIDSPDRAGSGCAAGTGGFWAKNGEDMNWGNGGDVKSAEPATRAPWLRLLVVGSTAWESGTRPCNGNKAGAVLLCNSNKFAGTIYAPASKVVLSNSVEFVGAVAGDKVDLENSVKFRLPNGLGTQTVGQTVGSPSSTRWSECRAGDTGSAC